jgi:hypothetical protein
MEGSFFASPCLSIDSVSYIYPLHVLPTGKLSGNKEKILAVMKELNSPFLACCHNLDTWCRRAVFFGQFVLEEERILFLAWWCSMIIQGM